MNWALLIVAALALPPYEREAFGGWRVSGHGPQGCAITAREAAIIEASITVKITGRRGYACSVDFAEFVDEYTGKTLTMRGKEVDVDHVVPLSYAWRHGAAWWSPAKRAAFANDPRNLVATTRKANRSKGDKNPSEWLPANRCAYLARWDAMRKAYGIREKFGRCED